MDEQNNYTPQTNGGNQPGKGAAVGSLVCGIVAIVFWFLGIGAIVSVILGVVGLVLSSNAKKAGFVGGMQTAGFVTSLLGLIFGAIFFVACVGCMACGTTLGGIDALSDLTY